MFDDNSPVGASRLLAKYVFAGSVLLLSSGNAVADLVITKTVDLASPSPAAENDVVTYNLTVTNTGPGVLTNVDIDDTPGNLSNLVYTVTSASPPPNGPNGVNGYRFNNLAAGETVTLDLDATVTAVDACPVITNTADVSENSGTFTDSSTAANIEYDFGFTSGASSNVIQHLTTSFCEFCDTGVVNIRITNPTTTPLTNIVLREDLQALGLTYLNGTTTVSSGSTGNPTITGGGTILTWDSTDLSALASLAAGATLDVSFEVSTFDEAQMLADPNRNIIADVTFETVCTTGTHNVDTGQFNLSLQQPVPQVQKLGRNYDANQNDWQNTVWGNFNDDIIWRVRVRNFGDAYLEALRMSDSITGNFTINYICPTLGDANDVGLNNGTAPGGSPCIAMTSPFDVADPFGSATDPQDIGFAGSPDSRDGFFYYVGRVQNNHSDEVNTADISWGCAAESPTGGLITTTANGAAGGLDISDPANLETSVTTNGLQITQAVTGTNTAQPLGTRGIVTITLNNQSGGSIQNLEVTATLPNGYVVDNTYGPGAGLSVGDPNYGQPDSTQTGAFGPYDGFIDTVTRDDAALLTADPLDDLNPHFTLTSTTTGADATQQVHMMREDDVITISFGIIMVDAARFDLVADLDVNTETTGDGTDPSSALTLSNTVTVDFDAVDPSGTQNQQRIVNFNAIDADPEDLDVDISDALFILTNDPGTPLDLNTIVTNNGGHDADNYTVYVTLGQAMTAQLPLPTGCTATSNPPPHPHWNQPAAIPATAAVYACDRGVIAPGAGNAETITFSVIKSAGAVDDDLTFRADVIGEIHYADSTAGTPNPLLDPAPASIANTTPNLQLANNYTLDGIRSRVLGFNLVQSAWYCAEDGLAEPAPPADIITPAVAPPNLPAMTGNLNSQIGEDCAFRIESGGWFGFLTPGFTLIAVQNVEVVQDLPESIPSLTNEGQGFIPFGGTSYNFNNTANIILNGANGGATTTSLDNNDITWQFNTATSINVKDEFFRVDFKTRMLNDPVDGLYPVPGGYAPNLHGNTSTGITRTSFDAIFNSTAGNVTINVTDQAAIPGYPTLAERTVDQTEVEPNLIVTKQVCNETLSVDAGNGSGASCVPFQDAVTNGDTNDDYVYRIVMTNESTVPTRSPAFNIISTDVLDASDLMLVVDFATDGLDNDGDGVADGADAVNEGALFASIPDNTINNGTPAVITVDETYNSGASPSFEQLDAGDSITFYYRVDPDITIAPLQTLTNTVDMTFDSLDGTFGNQNAPQLDNTSTAPNDAGRARIYNSITQTADVQMIPLLAQPKIVTAKSNTALGGATEDVSIGEEIRYLLVAELPVANLREFTIRDELPQGLSCAELESVNLSAGIYAAAGFSPGGPPLTTTCTQGTGAGNDVVEWYFGDQAVTASLPGNRFNFPISFVARVENTAFTNEGITITNGGNAVNPATCSAGGGSGAAVCYVNDSGTDVALDFASVDVVVREPVIVLTKSFAPVVNSDAGDILTVTVTAENTGTTAAYNLQLLDDLTGTDLTYINDSMTGPDAPDDDGVAANSKTPTFSWNSANPDYEILTGTPNIKTFTFQVQVDTTAQPLEILDNTIQAKWDSLPGPSTALNTSATIGADGTTLGLRNGALPNASDAINDQETIASDSTSVLPLTMSKTDLGPAVVNTIGAHRNFEVVINLPEGTTNNLVLEDNLMFGGVSYMLSRNASFDVAYSFSGIATINGVAPNEAAFTDVTSVVDTASGTLTWNIGTVVTDTEDDLTTSVISPQIVISYFARPNNDLATNDGDNMQNSATVTYDNGETAATETLNDTAPAQTVVEPLLTIAKAVTNVTNPGVGPVAGDVLQYVITVNHDGASTASAFDLNITDTIDSNTLLDTGFTPTALVDAVAVGGFVSAPAGTPGGPLVWGRGNTDNSIDLPLGSQLVLTYRTVVQNGIKANVDISNSVLIDWTSIDDVDPSNNFERNGDNDGVSCASITAPDDYCAGPAVTNITADDSNSITKTVTNDTYTEAPLSNATDAIVRVGDIITYQVDINLQQGTTDNINIQDTIPAGMQLVDIISINGDTTAPYDPPGAGAGSNFAYASIPALNVPAAGATLALNWNIGTVVNDAAGDATTDSLTLIYRLLVVENDITTIAQQPTTDLVNTADLTYIDGLGNTSPVDPRLTDTATVTVLQPVMDSLTKTDRLGRLSGITVDVVTDVMEFRLHTCNTTGLARAYGLQITDDLPTQMNEGSLAGPVNGALTPDVYINGVLATEGAANDYVYTAPVARGGTMVFNFNTPIDPGVCVDIDFNMGFYNDFGANQIWDNTVMVDEYHSLPPANGQLYPALVPVSYTMNNLGGVFAPPVKSMVTPAPAIPEATIGDEVVYTIEIPAPPGIMYDVTITDALPPDLVYLSATDIGPNAFALTDNTVLPGTVELVIPQMLVGQSATIELRTRVVNDANSNAGDSFNNTAVYRYANAPSGAQVLGGSDTTASTLTIIEPSLGVAKAVANLTNPGNLPDAGDVLRYTVTLTAAGGVSPGDLFSDAYDVTITDTMSLGLLFSGNPTVDGAGNTINAPLISGDGVVTPQVLSWSLADGNADIDVTEGTAVTVTYDVVVLDSVLANQDLNNSVVAQWHSRDGPDVPGGSGEGQRDGSAADSPPGAAYNDYFNTVAATTTVTTPETTTVVKTRLTDTFGAADNIVRIGDIIDYELRFSMQEGTHSNTVIVDTLPQGLIFEGTVSINGDTASPFTSVAPFAHSNFTSAATAGDPATGPTTVTWNLGDIVNTGDNLANNDFVIVYRTRSLNLALPQQNNTALTNTVTGDYDTATGAATTMTDNVALDLQQPDLSIAKAQVFTPTSTDNVIEANEVVRYRVSITNNGTAPAYDTELLDTIPLGLRSPTVTMVSTRLLIGGALPNLAPTYNAATGEATWNFDTGIADQYSIPAGDTLEIVYEVQADASLGAGQTLTNRAQVQFYYSFDNDVTPSVGSVIGVREIYVPIDFAEVVLDTTPAVALLKENPASTNISIGETFSYLVTVPETLQPTALHDVRILDNLNLSAAELLFVNAEKVSGSQTWTPVNTSVVAGDLVIEDITNGIDVPAMEQAVIRINVTLRNNNPPNVDGLLFNNTATYTFNAIDDNPASLSNGLGSTTADMTVVEPELTLDKRGPAGTVNFSTPINYTLVAENIGTGPAFDTTLVDQLPDTPDNPPLTGGTCDAIPVNFNARITTAADEATVVRALTEGADYSVTHTAAPTCELVITAITDAARIEAGEKLIVSYDASLDVASQQGALLTNIAGATQWFSQNTAGAGATGEIREYTRVITDGTTAAVDHEDAFTVTVDAPSLDVMKTVVNVTTGQDPGTDASPGDTLRYTITVNNGGVVDATSVTMTDAIPVNTSYVADSVSLNGLPVGQPDGGVSPLTAGIDISSADLTPPLPTAGNGVITAGQTATVTFDVILNAAIDSGTIISNQAVVTSPATGDLNSDDPINGNDDPLVIGDEDTTDTLVTSAPAFEVFKTSADITGDPGLLQPGDTLRYTLTVKNIGQENTVNTVINDSIPANTTYLANSTTLNGVAVADAAAGVSAIEAGMLINAPENTTAGFMRADTNAAANNVATIVFDVQINASAVIGTIISNQGFVNGDGAGSGVFPQQLSDDPDTVAVDDPTLDIVGNVALFDVQKTVAIVVDNVTPGIVDPGDTLRYTITATNMGAVPITNVVLTDAVPASTSYVADSVELNGLAVGQPDGGISPLIAGIDISSSDLTPPLPGAGAGVLSPGQAAVVTFDVQVSGAAPAGTVISNQGFVSNDELPTEPTDSDGIDSNGDQPTVVTVGSAPSLTITKQVNVIGGSTALAGGELEYIVLVTNNGGVDVTNVVLTDDLDSPVAGQMTYIAGSGRLNGLTTGVSFAGSTVTADYSTNYGNLVAGGTAELRFRTILSPALNIGDTVTNTGVVTWNIPPSNASASVDISIGGTPGQTNLNGVIWHDNDFDNTIDTGEQVLSDWDVSLYQNNVLLGTVVTDSNGVYGFSGLVPNLDGTLNSTATGYEVRYLAPGATASSATLGQADTSQTNGPVTVNGGAAAYLAGPQRITEIYAVSGSSIQNLNLPRQPNGIVYDAVQRIPVASVRLRMVNQTRSNQVVPGNCFTDPNQQNQRTAADGYYKFDLNFSDPTRCAQNDEYEIQVTPPTNGYVGTTSVIIPPVNPVTAAAQDVPSCPGTAADQVPATAQHCENSSSSLQPPDSVEPRTSGTDYALKFLFNNAPHTDQIFNNHIAVDPELEQAVTISKIAGMQNVTRSQLVPYTITINNTLNVRISDLNVVDNFPAGFKYVEGSSRIDGQEQEPVINGRRLTWTNLDVEVNESREIKLLLVVGSGVGEGEYVNTAQVFNSRTSEPFSGIASATVRVIPDPTFDCTDIIGKVYDDANLNAYQDKGEHGLAGVQVATARGLRATTDDHGRFHITCAVVPNEVRGSNFIMKVDERTLPSGYRMTTENPRVQRATRGKMMKYNFGAAIHRVVRLDLADGVFEKDSTELRPQWQSRIDLLITELEKDASILRLTYLGENETESQVEDRLDAIEQLISDRWETIDCCYKLTIEKEVFWRKGYSSDRKVFE